MTCREVQPLLSAWLDGELDRGRHAEIEAHRRTCAACAAATNRIEQLSAAVAAAPYYPAPSELRASLSRRAAPRWRQPALWLTLAAGFLVLAFALRDRPSGDSLEAEVVRAHVRSIRAGRLIERPASGRHSLQPWFAAKLDFPLPVDDISSAGFRLSGGRLDQVAGRPVAALVYRRGPHIINVFVWPATSADDRQPVGRIASGFPVVNWRSDGLNWWAISDLNLAELQKLPLCPCFLPAHDTLRG